MPLIPKCVHGYRSQIRACPPLSYDSCTPLLFSICISHYRFIHDNIIHPSCFCNLRTSVTVKIYSRKLVLPSTYFPGNKYSPILISHDLFEDVCLSFFSKFLSHLFYIIKFACFCVYVYVCICNRLLNHAHY